MSWKYKIHLKLTIKHSRRICKRMKFENLLFPPPSFSKNMQKTIFYSNYFLAPPCLPPPLSLSHCISIVPHPLFPFFLFSTFTPLIPFTVATTFITTPVFQPIPRPPPQSFFHCLSSAASFQHCITNITPSSLFFF